ncbi:hypothetical protein D3C77_586490 [compost metagenome]
MEDSLTRHPEEACGVLLGDITADSAVIDNYLPIRNISSQPRQNFLLDPRQWVTCCYNPRLIGLYHSHPSAPPVPSDTDLQQLPLFADLLKLYVIGSSYTDLDASRDMANIQGKIIRNTVTLNGYHIIYNKQRLPELTQIKLIFN